MKFQWGDTVRISLDAPKCHRPGELAEVTGMWLIETEENSRRNKEPVGSEMYMVEFGEGVQIRVPARLLTPAPNDNSK